MGAVVDRLIQGGHAWIVRDAVDGSVVGTASLLDVDLDQRALHVRRSGVRAVRLGESRSMRPPTWHSSDMPSRTAASVG